MAKEKLIRKTWPKIRASMVKGQKFYVVDARRTGTDGKREFFLLKEKAETRAAEIAGEFSANGSEGLAMPAALRVMALECDARLSKFGKTLAHATEHYISFLEAEQKRQAGATIAKLAEDWHTDRAGDKNKVLRAHTVEGIRKHSEFLKREFGALQIGELTQTKWQEYLNALKVGQRRKFNVNSLTSQFFNWCIGAGHTKENPTVKREGIEVPEREVPIMSAAECTKVMRACEAKHPDLTLNMALYIFAGLRPTEADLLKWEDIHLGERQLVVRAETSKVKESRTVPIEDNLLMWLSAYKGKRVGFVVNQTNLRKRQQALRATLGYRVNGENADAGEWVKDILRHSYGSYWLGKYRDRAHLAENMGNSVQVIRRHYKRPVSASEVAKFWAIAPKRAAKPRKAVATKSRKPKFEMPETLAA